MQNDNDTKLITPTRTLIVPEHVAADRKADDERKADAHADDDARTTYHGVTETFGYI